MLTIHLRSTGGLNQQRGYYSLEMLHEQANGYSCLAYVAWYDLGRRGGQLGVRGGAFRRRGEGKGGGCMKSTRPGIYLEPQEQSRNYI